MQLSEMHGVGRANSSSKNTYRSYEEISKVSKWSNTLKQFVGNLPTNCLSVFDHFMILALKGLSSKTQSKCLKMTSNIEKAYQY